MGEMKQLPKEIFLSVVSYLRTMDKLICIRVCRYWCEVIKASNLLITDLCFRRDINKLNKPFLTLYENEKLGHHTNELTLWDLNSDSFTVLTLPRLLPNVKHLKWIRYSTSNSIMDMATDSAVAPDHIVHLSFKPWAQNSKSLEIRQDGSQMYGVYALLSSRNFANLTRLVISIEKKIFSLNYETAGHDILRRIQNAPSFTSFTLENTKVEWRDLDLFHDKVPSLQHVELVNVDLDTAADAFNRRVEEGAANPIVAGMIHNDDPCLGKRGKYKANKTKEIS